MIDIVMTAQKMGIYVIVADREENSPAKRFADLALRISTDDVDQLEAICREEQINGVFTGFEDFNIHIARELCERIGLPFYATAEQLKLVTNKVCFKDKCREYGVPVIEQYRLDEALEKKEYPYIVKPTDSYGSRGITVCMDDATLINGVARAREVSSSMGAIIERMIDHDHGVELFYTLVGGKIRLTATADRYTVRTGETTVPLPMAEVFPSRHREELLPILDEPIRRMMTGMGLRDGLILVQALYDGKGGYFVYEMAYRLTGEQHYRMVEKQQGISLSRMMIRLALGEDISEYDTELLEDSRFDKPSINLALLLNAGRIARIEGLEKVYRIDEVISYNLTHAEQDVVRGSGDYSHMLIRVNMVAENYEKLCRAVAMVDEYVSVRSEDGKDMLIAHFRLP